MIAVYEKWARPDADGDMDTAWSTIVRALLGKWSTERCTLSSSGDFAGAVNFHGFGVKSEAFFSLPVSGSFDLALPGAGNHRGDAPHRGGFVLYLGAAGQTNTPTAEPIAAGAKTVTVTGAAGDAFKIELWNPED